MDRDIANLILCRTRLPNYELSIISVDNYNPMNNLSCLLRGVIFVKIVFGNYDIY